MKKLLKYFIVISMTFTFTPFTTYAQTPVQWSGNGHYYQIVCNESLPTWYEARDLASGMSYMDLPGHLATITSMEEDLFARNNFYIGDPRVWIGGTDENDEGNWRWVTGEPFVSAQSNSNGWGWNSNFGEPNGGTDENCMTYDDNSYYWNDKYCGTKDEVECFLVEFEAIEQIPTLSNYGIIILIIILTGSFYFISRRKTKYSCN